jgi:hypothetical protein
MLHRRPALATLFLLLLDGAACSDDKGNSTVTDTAATSGGSTTATTSTSDTPTTGGGSTAATTSTSEPATTGATTGDGASTGGAGTTDATAGTTGGPACDPSFPAPVCDGDLLAGDVLEPHEVYIDGTLSEGACYLSVLAHFSAPNDAVSGFDCYFSGDNARIRPTDGRLLYSMTFEGLLREFHCDTCPIAPMTPYPATPLNNDVVLPTPACDPAETTQMQFLLTPEGDHYYRCAQWEPAWYDASGAIVYESEDDPLLHVGRCKQGLTEQAIVDLESGVKTPIVGLPLGDPMTIRVAPEGGFWVVKTPEQPELWHVDANGVAASLGVYPQVPPDHTAGKGVLDGCGVLHQIGGGPEVFVDLIFRRELGGATEIVYTEATDPLVKLHISYLVTGP